MLSWLKGLIVAGVVIGTVLTGMGLLASRWPLLDIINNGLPFPLAGTLLLLVLAFFARDLRLIAAAAALLAINLWLAVAAIQDAAPQAASGSERALRVVTFNLWRGNDRMDEVAAFLADQAADAVVRGEMLRRALQQIYPNASGDEHLVILSSIRSLPKGASTGRTSRPGSRSCCAGWARRERHPS